MVRATSLEAAREVVVAEHIRAEMAGDIEATLATFGGPAEYDIVPLDELRVGAEVHELLTGLLGAFPDLGLHPEVVHHAHDAVIVQGRMTGTHLGPYASFPPTGRQLDLRAAIFFTFEGTQLRRETVYYDELTLLTQIATIEPPAAGNGVGPAAQ